MIRFALPMLAVSALAVPAAAEVQIAAGGPIVELTVNENVEVEPDIATIPISRLVLLLAFGSMLFGIAWMWRIYRAPTAFDTPRWRYRDR